MEASKLTLHPTSYGNKHNIVAAQRHTGRSMGEARGPTNGHAIFNKAVKNIIRKLLQQLMLRKVTL